MNLARSSLKLYIANVTSAGVSFLGITYFARELGATPIGVFFLFEALLGILAIPADFGLRGAVEKRISEGKSQSEYLSSAVILKAIPVVAIVLGILLLRSFINRYLGANIAVFLAVAIVLQEAAQLTVAVLKGELRVDETAVLQLVRQVTWVGVGVVLVSQGFGVVSLVYGLLTGLVFMLVLGWYKCSITLGQPSREHLHSLFAYGKYDIVYSVGGYFYNWMDVLIIGFFLTQAHVGAYEIAWRITGMVIMLSNSVASAIFPQLSKWSATEMTAKVEQLLPYTFISSAVIIIPGFVGGTLLSTHILRILFGQEYVIASGVLSLLLLEKVFEGGQNMISSTLRGLNRPDLLAKASLIAQIANVVLNLALISTFGLIGAAVGTLLASLIGDSLSYYYADGIINIRLPYKEVALTILSSVIMGVGIHILLAQVKVDTTMELTLVILTSLLIYAVFEITLVAEVRKWLTASLKPLL
ncbi:flippase [Haloprofundus salinisoli]|uniref:flippase n=1 Tax=Haloprofundus salinisoli TaxID=2876193 RepID=UPI001CCE22E5|nr:flippase [Haloprofundus salinisoli]